ncbi:MAG: InlB B-repeat-containing protein, partial [Clostridia bacterium]|nr:InlB B-repeat-containing protein [Clostridia bacterium]
MNFWVKLLAIFLVLVTLATTVASCVPQSNSNPSVQGGTTTNGTTTGGGITVLPPDDDNNNGNHVGGVVVGNVTAPYIGDVHVSAGVTPDENNQVPAEGVNLDSSLASAIIPGGVQMEEGATELSLTINGLDESAADVTLSDTEISSSLDVHVSGVAAGNLVPMEVKLLAAALKGLNSTSIKLYHVENGETVEMTYVPSNEPFSAHNQFKYDPATGDVILYIASFSEIMMVSDSENKWEGGVDHNWYDANATTLYIANAEQLWSFSQIVGGMAAGIEQDSFEDKTVTLLADINLGDAEGSNNPDLIFYPIGYNSDDGLYEKTGVAVSTGFYNFCGTFDGNGHTIANFYHNTWEMKGDNNYYDASLQYYRDGMGLFGRVYGGKIKNLTVSNFSSDGEYTTTGVIAAYADGATFENIAVFNCNPRVYNIGNGGIVGCVGWYAKEANLKTNFKNITVDNSNKISALWGSYDVACGGIVGQYYPTSGQTSAGTPKNGGIEFTNCHVSAVMDVYNDVCANYQYYAYRYTGMLIGSVRENETIDGRVYPKMDGIKAYGCTVHFGTWNDYYYCEIIDNTTASYTHDYQMSRLTEIKAIDGTTITFLDGTTGTVPASGRANYVIVDYTKGHGTENAACYHFKDGAVWTHDMGGIQTGIDETGDGQDDLKEDKQHIYLEFNNLFTGYGWGVTSVGLSTYENVNVKDKLADIEIGGGNVEGSDTKFEYIYTDNEGKLEIGKEYTLGELFAATGLGAAIKDSNVVVTVSPSNANTKVDFLYKMTEEDWTQSTLKISTVGDVTITITDYYFCKSTSVTVNVDKAHKFEYLYGENRNGEKNENHKDFLLRVGNQNTVSLNLLFGAIDNCYPIDLETLTVTATNGKFTKGNTWGASTISFKDYTGIATITIEDATSYSCSVTVEVVDGKNTTSAESATSGNIVLLGNAGLSSLSVSGRFTFYGNGFTLTYSGTGSYLNNGLKQGVVTVSENGTLDNVRIVAPIYPAACLYYGSTLLGDYAQKYPNTTLTTDTKKYYDYQLSAVALSGNGTVSNCYIKGGRNNIFVDTGNVTIKDTILECGTVANVQIQSNNSHTITFENVTTIQYTTNATIGDTSKVMLGAGVLVGPETNNNPAIVLKGNLKQYNWVNADDKSAINDTVVQAIIQGALDATQYNHTVNGKTASNLGIIYMNEYEAKITNETGLPYKEGTVAIKMSGQTVNGKAYSLQNANENQIYSDYENADRTTVNGLYVPQFKYDSTLGGQYEAKTEDGDTFLYREGDTIYVMFPAGDTKEVDLSTLVDISKYTGKEMTLKFTCVNSKGESLAITNNKVTLSAADTYTITYTLTDTWFYDKDGNEVTKSINYSWNVTLNVSLKDTASPDAYFKFVATNQKMGFEKKTVLFSTSIYQYIPFLAGLKIYDYVGQTEYLRFDGDNDFSKVASITVTNKYSGNDARIVVTLTDGGVIDLQLLARADSGGGSTYTGSIKTSGNTIYFVNDGTTGEKAETTTSAYWYVDYYKFTGNNGVAIQSGQQTFNSTGSSASTPSGSFGTTIKYTVSYDANGGNCGQTTGYATSAATAVTLPTPTRSGYIFAGWYTAADGGTRVG